MKDTRQGSHAGVPVFRNVSKEEICALLGVVILYGRFGTTYLSDLHKKNTDSKDTVHIPFYRLVSDHRIVVQD